MNYDHYLLLQIPIDKDVKWPTDHELPPTPNYEQFLEILGESQPKPALMQIMPVGIDAPDIIYYQNNLAALWAALHRQADHNIQADEVKLDVLEDWLKENYYPIIRPMLANFDYSVNFWYNHLSNKQQLEIDPCFLMLDEQLMKLFVEMFPKAEKQLKNGIKWPKTRCISKFNPEHIYCMGPIIFALEHLFKKNFNSYCSGMNWTQIGKMYDDWLERGLTQVVGTDFEGFDRSIRTRLQALTQHAIYKLIKPWHISKDVFDYHFVRVNTVVKLKFYDDQQTKHFKAIIFTAKVFSGESSTTFGNCETNRAMIQQTCSTIPQVSDHGEAIAGDDAVCALSPFVRKQDIIDAYYNNFAKGPVDQELIPTTKHGFGTSLKTLHIGTDITHSRFCSTSVYYCKTCGHHRVIRQLQRFVELTPYSHTIMQLKPRQQLSYMQQLHLANERWMHNLRIFRTLNDKDRKSVV